MSLLATNQPTNIIALLTPFERVVMCFVLLPNALPVSSFLEFCVCLYVVCIKINLAQVKVGLHGLELVIHNVFMSADVRIRHIIIIFRCVSF